MRMVEVYSEVLGEAVRVPEEPKRVVSLSPAITETLYYLGAWDRVVAISYFCEVPKGVEPKPRVGGYLGADVNRLKALKPDLVLATTGAQLKLVHELRKHGLPVYPVPLPISLYGVLDSIIVIGTVIGLIDEARRLANRLAKEVASIKPLPRRLRTYYEVDLGEPITVGAHTYIDHALEVIGLQNVFHRTRRTYFKPALEELLALDPELIIYEFRPGTEPSKSKVVEIMASRGLSKLRAVRNGYIVPLRGNTLSHYGPTLIDKLKSLRAHIARVLEA
jgi:ABC-type Fe3+-hydroxamate transport system substrate-binding protein